MCIHCINLAYIYPFFINHVLLTLFVVLAKSGCSVPLLFSLAVSFSLFPLSTFSALLSPSLFLFFPPSFCHTVLLPSLPFPSTRVNLDPSKRQSSNKSVSGCPLPHGSKTVSKFSHLSAFSSFSPTPCTPHPCSVPPLWNWEVEHPLEAVLTLHFQIK